MSLNFNNKLWLLCNPSTSTWKKAADILQVERQIYNVVLYNESMVNDFVVTTAFLFKLY